jgi:hypothetical protein
VRLASFLSDRYEAYTQALEREQQAVIRVAEMVPEIVPRNGQYQCERLRQGVLAPRETYGYLHDRLRKMRVSSEAGKNTQREILAHLKERELALFRFSTLLKGASDSFASLHGVTMAPQVRQFRKAVAEHGSPKDRLGAILDRLCRTYNIKRADLPQPV